MRMLSIEQKGYMPYTHTGTHFLHIDFMDRVTAIMSSNGFGKSSLLREISPYPPVRTDYQKQGYVKKVFKHDAHVYELVSDFKNVSCPHSFKEDGVELNISGTSETQRDLIEEKFGITQMIEDIMSMKYRICDMRPSERKTLFSAMYPSDLTFVLEYHKQVCSQIRTLNNQIKLLRSRDTSLRGKLMSKEQIEDLNKTRDDYNYIVNLADKLNLLLSSENERLQAMPEYHAMDSLSDEEMEIFRKCNNGEILEVLNWLQERYNLLIMRHPELHLNSDLNYRGQMLNVMTNDLNDKARRISEENQQNIEKIKTLRDELDYFLNCKNSNKEDEKEALEKSIVYFKEQIKRLGDVDETDYIISEDRLERVSSFVIPEITTLCTELHQYAGKLKTAQEIQSMRKDVEATSTLLSAARDAELKVQARIDQLDGRLFQLKSKGYPADCMRGCGIRESLAKMIQDTEEQSRYHKSELKKVQTQIIDCQNSINATKNALQAPSLALPIIERLWGILSRENLGDFVLKGGTFISFLNDYCTELPNIITKLYAKSNSFWTKKSYLRDLSLAEGKLETLQNAEKAMMSIEVINHAIAEREHQLSDLHRKLVLFSQQMEDIASKKEAITNMQGCVTDMMITIDTVMSAINYNKLRTRVAFNEKIIDEHTAVKNELNRRLREIETSISEQKNLHAIVEQEIEPTLKVLESDLIRWESVEFGLSPTKGLPFIYLVRFINRLISHVNRYIKEVWCYDMELVYLKESDNLDFGIQVLINKSSIVKDISICSDGQKAIINLAMTLAISKERGFGTKFPLKLDEVDAPLTDEHRTNLVAMLSRLVEVGEIAQLFLVNHFVIHSGMSHCETVCLSTDGIVVPNVFNEHVQIA